MPHLVYFGRLWKFSGDELSIPSICAATARIFWTIFLGIIYAVTGSYLTDCSGGWIIMLYLSLSIAISLASILCEILLAKTSVKGTIVNYEPRKSIEFFLTCHLCLGICQLLCAIFGICILVIESIPCSSAFRRDIVKALLLLTLISQIIDISGIVCCCNILSSRSVDLETYYQEPDLSSPRPSLLIQKQERDVMKWEQRCKSLCRGLQYCTCNLFGGSGIAEDLDAVAAILSDFFHHEGFLDVVPSDIVAGILLVRFQQRIAALNKKQLITDRLNNRSGVLSPLHPSSALRNYLRIHYSSEVENAITIVSLAIGDGLGDGYTLDKIDKSDTEVHVILHNRKKYLTALEVLYRHNISVGIPSQLKSNKDEPLKIVLKNSSQNLNYTPSTESYQDPTLNIPSDDEIQQEIEGNCLIATDYMEMNRIAHYAPYALAAYSTLMYLYINPCCGLCQLCHFSLCAAPIGICNPCVKKSKGSVERKSYCCSCGKAENITADNSCRLHEAALRKMSRLGDCDLIYANFSNEVTVKPYAVFVDYETQAIVITIRGTLSLEDCVTDAVAHPESMYEAGLKWGFDGTDRFAHSGMLKAANWIREDLKRIPRVAELLAFVSGPSPMGGVIYKEGFLDSSQNISTPLTQTAMIKKLVIVGHSLGAGTAAVLGILMKGDYPTLTVYGYGTPGSVLDAKTATDIGTYMTSCIFGDDVVGSLSFHSLHSLREKVLDSIARSKVSKMEIMQTTMFRDVNNLDHLLHAKGQEPDSGFKKMVDQYQAHMRTKLEIRGVHRLYHPGRIIHLRTIGSEKSSSLKFIVSSRRVYAPFVTNMNYFQEIHISPTMVLDHLPDSYVDQLRDLINDWSFERK